MDPDGTSTYLNSIDYQIISPGPYLARIGAEQFQILFIRTGKWMMHGMKAFALLIPFQQREVHHPQGFKYLRIAKLKPVSHLQSEFTEGFQGQFPIPGQNQDQIARFRLK